MTRRYWSIELRESCTLFLNTLVEASMIDSCGLRLTQCPQQGPWCLVTIIEVLQASRFETCRALLTLTTCILPN